MANSIITTYGDGTTTVFPISFTLGFISRSHVQCRVNNEVDGSMNPVYRELEWINDGLVRVLGATPADGVTVVFTRTVPKDSLIHDYSNGAAIEEQNLDDSNLQVLHAIGEFLDGRFTENVSIALNMNNNKIINVTDATDAQDAVNLRVLESRVGNAPADAAAAEAAREAAEDALAAAEAVLLQVETIYDNFDDRYLGSKTSDPTVDNDGNTLLDGALYYNTTSNVMRIYDLDTTSWNNVTTVVLDGSITGAKLADGAVSTSAKLADSVVTEAKLGFSDVTTGNSTASSHGLLPKLSGNVTDVLRGNGTFGAAPGAGKPLTTTAIINQTGTQSLIDGTNVASISDQGVGVTRITFTTPYPDTNYNVIPSALQADGSSYLHAGIWKSGSIRKTTTYVDIACFYASSSYVDSEYLDVCIFGTLAS